MRRGGEEVVYFVRREVQGSFGSIFKLQQHGKALAEPLPSFLYRSLWKNKKKKEHVTAFFLVSPNVMNSGELFAEP